MVNSSVPAPLNLTEQQRLVLANRIKPELDMIRTAMVGIERKLGNDGSNEKDTALQLAAITALSDLGATLVGLVGFCRLDGKGNVIYRASSRPHKVFFENPTHEMLLSSMMTNLLKLVALQEFEVPELVQDFREAHIKSKGT